MSPDGIEVVQSRVPKRRGPIRSAPLTDVRLRWPPGLAKLWRRPRTQSGGLIVQWLAPVTHFSGLAAERLERITAVKTLDIGP